MDVTPIHIDKSPVGPPSECHEMRGAFATLARSYPRGASLGLHAHNEAQLLFAARGVMQATTTRGRWLVPPDRAVWLPSQRPHAVDMLSDIEMRSLYVDPAHVAAHPKAGRLGKEFVVRVGPLLRELILGCFADRRHPERGVALGRLILFELTEAEDPATFIPMPQDPRARRVAELVLAEPDGIRDLEDLAAIAGTSARTVTRLFSQETSLSFRTWRQRARIMAAIEALGGQNPPTVKHLAHRLGFSSTAAFDYAFKQVTGTTPTAFMGKGNG